MPLWCTRGQSFSIGSIFQIAPVRASIRGFQREARERGNLFRRRLATTVHRCRGGEPDETKERRWRKQGIGGGGKPTELGKGESGAWKRKKECEQRRWKKKRKSRRSKKKRGRKIESGMRGELKYEGEKEGGENRTEKERKRWNEGWVDSGKN